MNTDWYIERLAKLGCAYFGKDAEYKQDLIVYEPNNATEWWCVDGKWHLLTAMRYRFYVDGVELDPGDLAGVEG